MQPGSATSLPGTSYRTPETSPSSGNQSESSQHTVYLQTADSEAPDSGRRITNKKELREYLINACDLPPEDQVSGCFSRPSKPVRVINQSVSQFREPKSPSADILPDFIHSKSGQRLHRKATAANFVAIEETMRKEGVDINAQSKKSGNTPLISAALNNHWEMVETLLDAAPPGSVAVKNKQDVDLLQLLLTQSAHNTLDPGDFNRVLHKILKNGHEQCSRPDIFTSFSARAFERIADRCDKNLLKSAVDALPWNAFHPMNHSEFAEQIFRNMANNYHNKSETITYLLSLNRSRLINPNAPSRHGFTPLMMACSKGKIKTAEALLNDHRVRDAIDQRNLTARGPWTAYTYAHYWGYDDIRTLLVSHQAATINAATTRAEELLREELRTANRSRGSSSVFGMGGITSGLAASIAGGMVDD